MYLVAKYFDIKKYTQIFLCTVLLIHISSSHAQTNSNVISIEAENYSSQREVSTHSWSFLSNALASNDKVVYAGPDSGTRVDRNFTSTSPRLDYQMYFPQRGVYYVWIRGIGQSDNDDSLHVGLNNTATKSADRLTGFSSTMSWSNATMDGARASIYVSSAGLHTINVWMREDGFVFDKLLVTTDSLYKPIGDGPSHIAPANTTADISDTSSTIDTGNALYISWRYDMKNPDGTLKDDLAGFVVYMSSIKGNYTKNDIIKNVTQFSISSNSIKTLIPDQLDPGIYYFAVTAYNNAGIESQLSQEVRYTVSY